MTHFIVTIQGQHKLMLLERFEAEIPLNEQPVFRATFDDDTEVFFEIEKDWELWDIVDRACACYMDEKNPGENDTPKMPTRKKFRIKKLRKPKWLDQ